MRWPTLEELVTEEQGHCWLCRGKRGPVTIENASRDHVIPKSARGSNLRHNLRLAHDFCNRARGARGPSPKARAAVEEFRRELVVRQRQIREEWSNELQETKASLCVPEEFWAVEMLRMWLDD